MVITPRKSPALAVIDVALCQKTLYAFFPRFISFQEMLQAFSIVVLQHAFEHLLPQILQRNSTLASIWVLDDELAFPVCHILQELELRHSDLERLLQLLLDRYDVGHPCESMALQLERKLTLREEPAEASFRLATTNVVHGGNY